MKKFLGGSYRIVCRGVVIIVLSVFCLSATPTITTVTANSNQVGKYAKIELTVGLTGSYTNPYDPDQIDLSATFTSPTNKTWKINGFYAVDAANGTAWKIRFAPDETGAWSYTVMAKDPTGTTQGPAGTFTCSASTNHGWVRVASNNRYLKLDDGTSFYGIGPCYPYNVTFPGFHQLQSYGCNTYVYWNGTNDGYGLIESMASGIGKYDQPKCRRVDSLLDSSEALGLHMILVLWPHDYLGQSLVSGWTEQWSDHTPYSSVVDKAADFYGDTTAWKYEQKMYRYIIARYSYHQSLGGWQTIDEINGTDGWVSNQAAANAWTTKMADFFHTNDPFKHPTNASEANDLWAHGDSVNDFSNTENYNSTTPASWASLVQKLWNGFLKPAICGESINSNAHNNLWSTLATGIAITPLMWQFNVNTSVWPPTISANWPPVAAFVADINFAYLTGLAQATVTVSGATAYGIKSNEVTFGWITGTFSGKSISVAGVANKTYSLTWFNCTAGTVISTSSVTVTNGTLTATVPTTTITDIAFKAISPTTPVIVKSAPQKTQFGPAIAYESGVVYIRRPTAENSALDITTALGSVVGHSKVTDAMVNRVPIKRLGRGIYFVGITSGKNKIMQRIIVK